MFMSKVGVFVLGCLAITSVAIAGCEKQSTTANTTCQQFTDGCWARIPCEGQAITVGGAMEKPRPTLGSVWEDSAKKLACTREDALAVLIEVKEFLPTPSVYFDNVITGTSSGYTGGTYT